MGITRSAVVLPNGEDTENDEWATIVTRYLLESDSWGFVSLAMLAVGGNYSEQMPRFNNRLF